MKWSEINLSYLRNKESPVLCPVLCTREDIKKGNDEERGWRSRSCKTFELIKKLGGSSNSFFSLDYISFHGSLELYNFKQGTGKQSEMYI